MQAEQSLREGNLKQALAQLQKAVRSEPANPKLRIFLFQLLCLLGEWEKALNQLTVAGELDAANLAVVQTYREAIRCEALRAAVFSGRFSPTIFGDPQPWMALLIESLKLTAEGRSVESESLRARAFEEAPATPGSLDGKAFAWIADADSRLGPMLEAIVNGRYFWVPFQQIQRIELEKPQDLRDLVWLPCHFQWANGGIAVGLIPTRYAGSEQAEDAAIRMARRTEWLPIAEGAYRGLGQRILATDIDEFPLLDIRQIQLTPS